MAFSLSELVSAVFNGAPTPELAEKYTAQITALISLYICFVSVFLIGLYIRRVRKLPGLTEERRIFKIWIAWSLAFAIAVIAASVIFFVMSVS